MQWSGFCAQMISFKTHNSIGKILVSSSLKIVFLFYGIYILSNLFELTDIEIRNIHFLRRIVDCKSFVMQTQKNLSRLEMQLYMNKKAQNC